MVVVPTMGKFYVLHLTIILPLQIFALKCQSSSLSGHFPAVSQIHINKSNVFYLSFQSYRQMESNGMPVAPKPAATPAPIVAATSAPMIAAAPKDEVGKNCLKQKTPKR